MSGPGSPGGEGPTQAPPHLPPGWIAQWDSNSKKYYYVQLSTGVSQWDVPTDAAPIGGTPAANVEHPYGVPSGQPELITHPDGTQTVKHADGRMEPVMPDESGGTRAIGADGQTGDRGLGSMAMNALLGNKQSGNGHNNSNNFGGLATSVLSGLTHSSNGNHGSSGGHSSGSGGLGGKLVGQLASNLFSSGNKPQQTQQQQNYHGGQTAQSSSSGGLAGALMGQAAHMFGGQPHNTNQNYGYSNASQQGTYNGAAPPTSYQPSGIASHQSPVQQAHTPQGAHGSQPPSYHTPASNPPTQSTPSYHTPTQAPQNPYGHQAPQHTPSFPPPPTQYEGGQQGYPGPAQHGQYGQHGQLPGPPPGQPPSHTQYGGPAPGGPQYGASSQSAAYGHQQPGAQAYGGHQGGYPSFQPPPGQYQSQTPYANQGPAIPHGSHPYGSNPQY